MEQVPFEQKKQISRRSLLKGATALGAVKVFPLLEKGAEAAHGHIRKEKIEKEAVEKRIVQEVVKARAIIASGEARRFFESSYLIYALYYSENFLQKKLPQKTDRDVSEEIIVRIAPFLTAESRRKYMQFLEDIGKGSRNDYKTFRPLKRFHYGYGKNHSDAVDLFIDESTPVNSITGGIVILAEKDWSPDNPFSVSSLKGGNAVLVYDATEGVFYRYCHLQDVRVKPYAILTGGMVIGTVGHTGTNASQPGHGKHLHLEINQYDSVRNNTSAVLEGELKKRIEAAAR